MCDLYSMTRNREAILRPFRISDNGAASFAPEDAIFSGYQASVVRKATDGKRELTFAQLGLRASATARRGQPLAKPASNALRGPPGARPKSPSIPTRSKATASQPAVKGPSPLQTSLTARPNEACERR